MEEKDITDDLVPSVGLPVLSGSQCTAKAPCDLAFMIFLNVYLFLNTLSGMINVDTLIDAL